MTRNPQISERPKSEVDDQLPIYNKFKGKSVFEMTNSSLQPIKEEMTGYGKRAEIFRASMMTPADRVNGGYEYDILTGSFRSKVM